MIEPGTVCPTGDVPDDRAVRRGAVDRGGLVGDLEAGLLQPLPRQVLVHARRRWAPSSRARRRRSAGSVGGSATVAEVVGDRLHRGEPGAGGLVAAEQVARPALAQRERAQLARRRWSRRRCSWRPANVLVNPRNADERCASVVPVLPDIGRSQPTEPADPAAVPPPWSSLLIALASVLARPSGTTCSQVSVVTDTSLAVAVEDLVDRVRRAPHAAGGQRRGDVGQLQRVDLDRAQRERAEVLPLDEVGQALVALRVVVAGGARAARRTAARA